MGILQLAADAPEIEQRFDLWLRRELMRSETPRHVHERVVRDWRHWPRAAELIRRNFADGFADGETAVAAEEPTEIDRAVRNLADYLFEPYAVMGMSMGQFDIYQREITRHLSLRFPAGLPAPDAPLVLESLHHHCLFAVQYCVARELVLAGGFHRVVMLHQNDPPDPRLIGCENCFRALLGVDGRLLRVDGDWMDVLREEVTPQTIVMYVGDIPRAVLAGGASRTSRSPRSSRLTNTVRLYREDGNEIRVAAVSTARRLAMSLKARHWQIDFPDQGIADFHPAEPGAVLSCPFPEWVFWPLSGIFPRVDTDGKA